MKKNRKSMWLIILTFIFIFSTAQICIPWQGINDGQDNDSDTEQEADMEESDGAESDEEEEED